MAKEISQKFYWMDYFVKDAQRAMDHEDSIFNGSIGRRRSGKSMFELARQKKIDPDFDEDNVIFTASQFMKVVQDPEIKHVGLMWDEASVTAYNRDYADEVNKTLNKVLQVFGYKELSIGTTFPHLKFLDSQTRTLLDSLLKFERKYTPAGVKVYAEPYAVITDWMRDPVIKPYKVNKDGVFHPIGKIPIPTLDELWKWSGINNKFLTRYQKKKIEFFEELGDPDAAEDERKTKLTKKGMLVPVVNCLVQEENYPINRACEIAGVTEQYYHRVTKKGKKKQ